MRDAFGGTFMIQLMLVFLIIYVSLLAVGYNYAKAFRTKNTIIDYIERYEGYNESSKAAIDNFLDNVIGYNVPSEGPNGNFQSNHPDTYCDKRGYCIGIIKDKNSGKITCMVTTFISINIFGIGDSINVFRINIPNYSISGEVEVTSPYWKNDFNLMEV